MPRLVIIVTVEVDVAARDEDVEAAVLVTNIADEISQVRGVTHAEVEDWWPT